MSDSQVELKINMLRSGYETSQEQALTVSLPAGKHLALSGRSGSGKTSLLQVLAGLQPASSGHFLWQGQEISAANLRWWRQQFCYLPQTPVMGGESVVDALRLPWALKALKDEMPDDQRCVDVLLSLDIEHDLEKAVSELSGGEKQRVAIARALLMDRPVWLLDEPTSALDRTSRDQVMAQLALQPLTCVSVSHDPHWLASAEYQIELGGRDE
ncbi:ABC transporter ATP-binding protein [Photobacterium sp. TLY01]|nr:ABC transporter ATP-binding protein [Photobacterium sp. TLY01]UIP30561.1 ABC transporter ATP-binding protein [Photobacterium sp. TLY01]